MTAYQNVCLNIGKGKLGAVQERLLLAVNPVVLADVLFQTPGSQCLLLFCKPCSSTGEVGQDEDSNYGNGDGDSAFNDEQPPPRQRLVELFRRRSKWILPGTETQLVVHAFGDTSGNQTGESA